MLRRDATHVLRLGRRRYDDLVLDARRKGSLARCLAPTARAAANCELQLHVVGAHPHLLVFTRKVRGHSHAVRTVSAHYCCCSFASFLPSFLTAAAVRA